MFPSGRLGFAHAHTEGPPRTHLTMPDDNAGASTHPDDSYALLGCCHRPRSEAADVLRCRSCIVVSKGGDPIPPQERELPHTHGRPRPRRAPTGRLRLPVRLAGRTGGQRRLRPTQEAPPSGIRRNARATGEQTPDAFAPTTGGPTRLYRLLRDEGADKDAARRRHHPDVGPAPGPMAPATPERREEGHH